MANSAGEKPDPNKKLIRVFDTDEESEAFVVRGLLESSGIDCDMANLEAPQDILPGVGGIIILVREEDAAEARRLIEGNRRDLEDDSDGTLFSEGRRRKP